MTTSTPTTVTVSAAPARTDATAPSHAEQVPSVSITTARRTGVAVLAGSLVWAVGFFTVGANPGTTLGTTISDLSALPFQIGLFTLVALQLRTRATGTSRAAVGMLKGERVLLTLATAWTVLHGAVPAFRDDAWLAVLDLFWPLSMLGMAIIGVKIAVAGRWRGAVRAWPAVAESWAVVNVPVFGALGPGRAADLVSGSHVLLGYCTLGLLLLLRPELTGARD